MWSIMSTKPAFLSGLQTPQPAAQLHKFMLSMLFLPQQVLEQVLLYLKLHFAVKQ